VKKPCKQSYFGVNDISNKESADTASSSCTYMIVLPSDMDGNSWDVGVKLESLKLVHASGFDHIEIKASDQMLLLHTFMHAMKRFT